MSERGLTESKIMVVDDDQANILLVERLLEWAGYSHAFSFSSAGEALKEFDRIDPDLLMLDLRMPGVDGFEFLRRLHQESPGSQFVPVLVFTCDSSAESRTRALELGASDFLTKPGDSAEILLRVRNFLKTRRLHRELENQNLNLEKRISLRTAELEETQREVIERLGRAAEYRDDETGEHTHRVAGLSALIAAELGMKEAEVELIRLAAPLHDVGKIGISDTILLKPGSLSEDEFKTMTEHTAIGARILSGSRSPVLILAETIAASHHERWDGSGYPTGLKGDDIPLVARIVSVADVFDALTHDRPYKSAWPSEKAAKEIESQSGKAFDPRVVEAFVTVLETAGVFQRTKKAA